MKKKLIIGLTSLVLVAAMAIGGTLAFMTQKTATMTNTFVAAAGLSGEIREPKWDGFTFDDQGHDGTVAKDATATLGLNQAKAMTPGQKINKDPTLKNTSAVPVYMAIKVTYDTKTKFDAIASPLTLNAGWVESTAGSGIYYYVGDNTNGNLKAIPAGNTTATSLFNTVDIKTDATTETLTTNQFKITVIGGAVQTTDIDDTTAKTQLATLLG